MYSNDDTYDRDFDTILDSPYYIRLGYIARNENPGEFITSSEMDFLISKESIVESLAERYRVDDRYCVQILRALDLATPPLGEIGLKFMQEKLGVKKKQAAIAIAEELNLSQELITALKNYDTSEICELALVGFVQENFDDLPFLRLDMIETIIEDVLANSSDNDVGCSPELESEVKALSEKKIPTKLAMREKELFKQIEDKLEGLTDMEAVLKFLKMSDMTFGYEPHIEL